MALRTTETVSGHRVIGFLTTPALPELLAAILRPSFPQIYCNEFCIKTTNWELNIGDGTGEYILIHKNGSTDAVIAEMRLITRLTSATCEVEILDEDKTSVFSASF